MVVLCVVAVAPAPVDLGRSVAHLPGVHDPREGPHFVLDVERARAARSHAITGTQVAFRLHTYEPYTNADLEQADGDDYSIAIGISIDADRAFERLCYVSVRGDFADQDGLTPYGVCTSGKRVAEADLSSFTPRALFLGYALVRREDEDSIEVTIPAPLLALPPSRRFHWQVRMASSPGSGSVYYDYVPDDRLARGRGRK